MKSLKLLLLSIFTVFLFAGCTVLPSLLGAVFEPGPGKDWAKKAHFERLMNYPNKVLLSEDEKVRAAKNICALNHLDKDNLTSTVYEDAEKFCKLDKDDKIYFFKDIVDTYGSVSTQYLLIRDGKAFESITIAKKYSKELGRSIPIVDRLH